MDNQDLRKAKRAAWDKVAFEVPFYEAKPNGLFAVEVGIAAVTLQYYNRSIIGAKLEVNKLIADKNLPKPEYVQTHLRNIDGWDFVTITIEL